MAAVRAAGFRVFRDGNDAVRAEHRVAAHRRAFQTGGEFLDVAAGTGDGGGQLADDARAVVADDIHDEGPAGQRVPRLPRGRRAR